MSKFTPGPWMFDDMEYIFAEPMGEGKMIAQIRGWGWLQYKGEEIAIAEQEANARLISASPKLYDFVFSRAEKGDTEAKELLDSLRICD